jgi:hypothetical protein
MRSAYLRFAGLLFLAELLAGALALAAPFRVGALADAALVSASEAWAAAKRATGTRNGEQLT